MAAPSFSLSRFAELRARDIMQAQLVTIDASAPLSEVERILSESRVSGAPVIDARGAMVGVVSMRDLIERYTEDPDARPKRERRGFYITTDEFDEEEVEAFETPAESEDIAAGVMTASVYSIDVEAPVAMVAKSMAEHQIHRVLVTEAGKPVGLISSMDVLEALAGAVGHAKRRVTGAGPARRT